ncbi:MAG: CcoQ/FixQ family Cbb3-type cytochrome c oxidase assembly chaperone [Solitalea-like symbiont of Acarus siro]
MKFSNYIKAISEHIDIFPTVSILIFFTFFVAACIYAFTRRKDYTLHCKNIPLDDEEK